MSNLIIGQTNYITVIPAGVRNLKISLTSNHDIDLKLYLGDETGRCIAGYECEHPVEATWQETV